MDHTGADDPVIPTLLPTKPIPTQQSRRVRVDGAAASVHREAGHASDGVPPVLNAFLTWLNAVDDKKVGGLARAFHLAMQLAGCDVPNFPHDSLRRQWERLRASLPLKPTVTQATANVLKAHPQDDPSVPAVGQGPAVHAQKTNQSTGGPGSGGWVHSDPAQFPVGCNVQWTPVSDPLSQPMCARVLAGFLHSHFHANLCPVLDEYVRAKVSFANLGVREEARALVEQGDAVTQGGWRVQWQKSYRQAWTPYTGGGKGGSTHRSTSSTCASPTPRGARAAAAPPAPAPGHTDSAEEGERRCDKRSRSETPQRSRSPSRERRSHRHGGSRRSRSWSLPSRWPRHVDSYYGDRYLRNPMTSTTGPPFQYRATYGYLPAHSGATTATPSYESRPPSLGHSLLPSPGNGQATYPNPANIPPS